MRKFRLLSGTALSVAIIVNTAFAITIDKFEDDQAVTADGTTPVDSSVLNTAAIGGTRSIETTAGSIFSVDFRTRDCLSGIGLIRCLSHSQNSGASGFSSIVWDGDAVAGLSNPTGLGGLDLTEDGATAFKFQVVFFDYPAGQPLDISIIVYDSSDATGNTFATGTITLDKVIDGITKAPEELELLFSDLTPNNGKTVQEILSSTGALELTVSGLNFAYDMDLTLLGTNGVCDQIPTVAADIVDDCGVCGGDNSTCLDCQGVANGNSLPGSDCNSGQSGICEAGTFDDNCQCQSSQIAQSETCDGLDNDCDGQIDEITDKCGVCGGDGSTCCEETNQESELRKLDGGAKRLERAIREVLNTIKKILPHGPERKSYRVVRRKTHQLQVRNWILSWQLPVVSVVCKTGTLCATSSNNEILDEYRLHNKELWKIFRKSFRDLKRLRYGYISSEDRQHRKYARGIYRDNLKRANSIPEIQYNCLE